MKEKTTPCSDHDIYGHTFAPEAIKLYESVPEEQQTFFNFGQQMDKDIQLWNRAKRSARTVETYYGYLKKAILRAARVLVNERAKETDRLIHECFEVGDEEFVAFCKKVRQLDWYASFSDSSQVYRNFCERHDALTKFAKTQGPIYLHYLTDYQALICKRIQDKDHLSKQRVERFVVSAAMRSDTAHVVVSVRHWDHLAHEQVRLLGDMAKDWTWVQGFVDNKGKFVTREEALVIAEEAGQRFWDELRYEQLFSENLY